jgi:uncharacterized protein
MMRIMLALLVASSSLFADAASKDAKIEAFLKLIHADIIQDQIYAQLNGQIERATQNLAQQAGIPGPEQLSATAELRDKMTGAMKQYMSWDKLKPGLMKIYRDLYSEEELDAMLTFFRSPVGLTYISRSPQVAAQSRDYAQNQMKELGVVFQGLGKEWMDAHPRPAKPAPASPAPAAPPK